MSRVFSNFVALLLIFVVLMNFAMVGEAKPKPQADAFTSGSILSPWGGNLGGGKRYQIKLQLLILLG